jgi:Ca-activated chloride channel family protein
MEKLADSGNGNYAYIDSLSEARKVLVRESGATLVTIAKDVKIQVEFNPARVSAYRLIGYENRVLAAEDFNDDQKDAGEIGAGHSVTALYEVVPVGVAIALPRVDPLKYQAPQGVSAGSDSDELLTVKLRYKEPDGETSRLTSVAVEDDLVREPSANARFAAAVAAFGMLLRDSEHSGAASFAQVTELARGSLGRDREGYRAQFCQLVEVAAALVPPVQISAVR